MDNLPKTEEWPQILSRPTEADRHTVLNPMQTSTTSINLSIVYVFTVIRSRVTIRVREPYILPLVLPQIRRCHNRVA